MKEKKEQKEQERKLEVISGRVSPENVDLKMDYIWGHVNKECAYFSYSGAITEWGLLELKYACAKIKEEVKPNGEVVIKFNTPGGDASCMTDFVAAFEDILKSNYKTRFQVGKVSSAGFYIFLALIFEGYDLVVDTHSIGMAHFGNYYCMTSKGLSAETENTPSKALLRNLKEMNKTFLDMIIIACYPHAMNEDDVVSIILRDIEVYFDCDRMRDIKSHVHGLLKDVSSNIKPEKELKGPSIFMEENFDYLDEVVKSVDKDVDEFKKRINDTKEYYTKIAERLCSAIDDVDLREYSNLSYIHEYYKKKEAKEKAEKKVAKKSTKSTKPAKVKTKSPKK